MCGFVDIEGQSIVVDDFDREPESLRGGDMHCETVSSVGESEIPKGRRPQQQNIGAASGLVRRQRQVAATRRHRRQRIAVGEGQIDRQDQNIVRLAQFREQPVAGGLQIGIQPKTGFRQRSNRTTARDSNRLVVGRHNPHAARTGKSGGDLKRVRDKILAQCSVLARLQAIAEARLANADAFAWNENMHCGYECCDSSRPAKSRQAAARPMRSSMLRMSVCAAQGVISRDAIRAARSASLWSNTNPSTMFL